MPKMRARRPLARDADGVQVTERDLDRLVTKTATSPICLQTLRYVRKAIQTGNAGEAVVSRSTWAIAVRRGALSVTFTFPLKES